MNDQYQTNPNPQYYSQDADRHYQPPTDDDRLFAALIYVSSFFTLLICPLIIWMVKRDQSKFVDIVGKDYLNFTISYYIWCTIASILMLVLIGIVLLPILGIMMFIFTIIGAIKSYNGETYLAPLSIRFFK